MEPRRSEARDNAVAAAQKLAGSLRAAMAERSSLDVVAITRDDLMTLLDGLAYAALSAPQQEDAPRLREALREIAERAEAFGADGQADARLLYDLAGIARAALASEDAPRPAPEPCSTRGSIASDWCTTHSAFWPTGTPRCDPSMTDAPRYATPSASEPRAGLRNLAATLAAGVTDPETKEVYAVAFIQRDGPDGRLWTPPPDDPVWLQWAEALLASQPESPVDAEEEG